MSERFFRAFIEAWNIVAEVRDGRPPEPEGAAGGSDDIEEQLAGLSRML